MLNARGGFIYFNMSSLTYCAGDSIKGELYIKLAEDESAESVSLTLTGLEACEFSSDLDMHDGLNVILNESMVLHAWPGGKAPRGDYIFPFEISLPPDIPGSTCLSTDHFKASIEYRLEAYMNPGLLAVEMLNVRCLQDFSPCPNASECVVDVKSCCCIKRGTVELVARANKFAYTSSEVVKLTVEGICELMPRVSVSLVRSILLTSNDGRHFMNKQTIIEFNTDQMHLDVDLRRAEKRLKMQCSTKGKIISCSYNINVTGEANAVCGREEIAVILWVLINPISSASIIPRYSVTWKPIYMNGIKFHSINLNTEN